MAGTLTALVPQGQFSSQVGLRGGLPCLPLPPYVNNRTVTTAEDETVPATAAWCVIISDAAIWWALGTGAAVVPTGDVTDGSGSSPLGAWVISPVFAVTAGQKISVVSPSGTAHVAFWYYLGAPV